MTFAARDAMTGELEIIKTKYEETVVARKKSDDEIEAFRPVSKLPLSIFQPAC